MESAQIVEISLALALGIALAAAAGLRVFVPLLAISLASHFGGLQLGSSFEWLASTPALITFAVAATVEVSAYYIPGLDHLLDLITTPLALVAGTLLVVAPLGDLPPLMRWSIALIAGAGTAGLTQLGSTLLRLKSGALTGGVGNPVVATGELGGSLALSVLGLLLPLLAMVLLVVALWMFIAWRRRVRS